MSDETHCGFVAVLGAPNAGKSTLVNAVVGTKVSIVTQKVQTTRMPVRGIAMRGQTQIVFIDTPGIFSPKRRLDRAMVKSAWAADAEVTLLLVDASDIAAKPQGLAAQDTQTIIDGLKEAGRKVALVLNKIDAVPRPQLLPMAQDYDSRGVFEKLFMVSAQTGDGLKELMEYCAQRMPAGPFLYPEDQAADIPSRLLAAEITREKLYLRLHDELPYASTVITESWKDQKDGSVRIDQTIFVARDGQKAIVIGKGGQTIKHIGESARREMETLFGHRVHLFLHTKVDERWDERQSNYSEWGLDYSKDQ